MHNDLEPATRANGLRVGVAVSRYHNDVTTAMRDAAVASFVEAGGAAQDATIVEAPGSFELIAVCRAFCERGSVDAVVALGCIIAGETTHDQHLADAVANGLAQITVRTGVPIAFGVLTCQSLEQARARAGGDKGNKGAEAMHAAIATARAVQAISGERQRAQGATP